jgi:hypothetical protein
MAAEAVCPARQISGEQLQNSVSISHVFPRAYEPRALLFRACDARKGISSIFVGATTQPLLPLVATTD